MSIIDSLSAQATSLPKDESPDAQQIVMSLAQFRALVEPIAKAADLAAEWAAACDRFSAAEKAYLEAYMEGDDSEEARARIQAQDTADQEELAARLALRELGGVLNAEQVAAREQPKKA